MLVEFLTPAKLPRVYGRHKKLESSPIITLNFRTRKIYLSAGLNNGLCVLESEYTHLQFAKGEEILKDKSTKKKAFIVPTKNVGWLLQKNDKSKSYCFSSTPLLQHIKELWDIPENHKIVKIPVFIEPTEIQGVKCLEINLSYLRKNYGNTNQIPN